MSATNFNTKNDTYRKLLGNGLTYRVPRFQRDYSWGEEEWDDLWQDILGTLPQDGEPAHYMGYLVLQSGDDKIFEVIDGQQRLTTLSLIVLSGLRILKKLVHDGKDSERNRQRMEQIRSSYIGFLDPVTLVPRSKLTLNRNNDDYFQRYLVPLEEHLPQRGFSASVHAMRKAFEWFEKRLRDYVKASADPGMAVAQFIESVSDKLFFTVITVADELNAYKVFETLNARGVRLSATDLLKNYLFSVLHRGNESLHELDELERRWESMIGRLGSESFPDFLRMHWNSRENFARQSELFKTIRGRVSSREKVFELLRSMDEDIDTYLALTQPEGSQWPPNWRQCAGELRMFSVRQPFSMLMAAKRSLADADFETLLRSTVVLAFRYNVIGAQHTGEQERIYHGVALRIARGELQKSLPILEALRGIYPNDETFRLAFSEKSIKTTASRNKKVVRYILCALEKQASGQDFDYDSSMYTLEHVLPQNPAENWEQFRDGDLEGLIYRLGNMAMLEAGQNRDIGNSDYPAKQAVLNQSVFSLTRAIAEQNQAWTAERIEARQRSLANVATSVWRIAQLS
jgi:hypothetical protein